MRSITCNRASVTLRDIRDDAAPGPRQLAGRVADSRLLDDGLIDPGEAREVLRLLARSLDKLDELGLMAPLAGLSPAPGSHPWLHGSAALLADRSRPSATRPTRQTRRQPNGRICIGRTQPDSDFMSTAVTRAARAVVGPSRTAPGRWSGCEFAVGVVEPATAWRKRHDERANLPAGHAVHQQQALSLCTTASGSRRRRPGPLPSAICPRPSARRARNREPP